MHRRAPGGARHPPAPDSFSTQLSRNPSYTVKIHLPLALRGLLLTLMAAGTQAVLADTPTDVSGIGYVNPIFENPVSGDLNFSSYTWKGNHTDPDLKNGDSGTGWIRLEILGTDLTLSGDPNASEKYDVSFRSPIASSAYPYTGRAIHAANGHTFEAGYLGTISFSDHIIRNADSSQGTVVAHSGAVLHFHHNDTVLFENNAVYGDGSAVYLDSSSLLMENNGETIFRNNGSSGWEGLAGSLDGGAIYLKGSELTVRNNGSVLFEKNVNRPNGGAISSHQTDGGTSSLEFSGNDAVIFSQNTSLQGNGGAIYLNGSLAMSGNKEILFSENSGLGGGAISNVAVNISGNNGSVRFEKNTATDRNGGAIYADQGDLSLSDNTELAMTQNRAVKENSIDFGRGGAIYSSSHQVSICGNSIVTISENAAGDQGGAFYINTRFSDYTFDFSDNATALFSKNTAIHNGGAIALIDTPVGTFENNDTLTFADNSAGTDGGAISSNSGRLSFSGNSTLRFSGNTAGGQGGAIYSKARTLLLADNDAVEFTNNHADGNGGAIAQAYNNSNYSVSLDGNDAVAFINNSSNGLGGAIYTIDTVSLTNNKSATFRGNHTLRSDDQGAITGAALNAIHATRNAVLSTQSEDISSEIVFYDPVLLTNGIGFTILNSYTPEGESDAVTGSGNIVFSGEHAAEDLTAIFEANGLEAAGDVFDSCLAESKASTIANKVILAGGILEIRDEASVSMGQYAARTGSETRLAGAGALTVSGTATFEAGSVLSARNGGGTLTASAVSLTQATLDCGTRASDLPSLTVNGKMTLTNADIIFHATAKGDGYAYGKNASFVVDGSLTVSGDTRILFAQGDEEAAFQAPEGNTILFAYQSFTGNSDDWKLLTTMTDGEGNRLTQALENYRFETIAYDEEGRQALMLVTEAPVNPDPTPDPDTIVIATGESRSISDLAANVSLQGGTLDASGVDVSTPLTNDVIKGSEGILKMSDEQTFVLTGNDRIGYDIEGAEPEQSAGAVLVGEEGGSLTDTVITFAGKNYLVDALNVRSGVAIVEENAQIGSTDTTVMTVGSHASLNNKGNLAAAEIEVQGKGVLGNSGALASDNIHILAGGTLKNEGTIGTATNTLTADASSSTVAVEGTLINTGAIESDVTVSDGGKLTGSGTFASVTIETGGFLMAGNSPGTPVYTNLALDDGATMAFAVDGTAKGTYSCATVTDTLTLSGTPTVEVSVGSGIVTAGRDTFTLTLLNAANVAGDGAFDPIDLKLTGATDLLEDGASIAWDAATGTLTFTGRVNENAALTVSGDDASRLADTMWSSVTAVSSFARRAMEQGRSVEAGKGRFWASGFGDFTSMGADGGFGGFTYNGGGYALGGDASLSEKLVVGAAIGQEFGTHKSDDALLSDKQRSLMFALYGNYRETLKKGSSLDLSGYFAYGNVDHTARTHIGGSQTTPGRASWNDDAFAAGFLAHWNIAASETATISPFAGLTYMRGSQGSITETFDGGSRRFDDGSMQVWSLPVGVTVKSACSVGNGQTIVPELTVAYVGDIARQDPRVRTQSMGRSVSGKGHAPGRNAVMARAGLGWQISDTWSTGAWYTLEARSGQTNQSVNLNVTYSF